MTQGDAIEGASAPPPGYGAATVLRVSDALGERAVVTDAEDRIACADELIAQVSDPARPRLAGDLVIQDDLLSFGTLGEGMGRLTYRKVGYDAVRRWHLFERVD